MKLDIGQSREPSFEMRYKSNMLKDTT
jgi:hypothetical protein